MIVAAAASLGPQPPPVIVTHPPQCTRGPTAMERWAFAVAHDLFDSNWTLESVHHVGTFGYPFAETANAHAALARADAAHMQCAVFFAWVSHPERWVAIPTSFHLALGVRPVPLNGGSPPIAVFRTGSAHGVRACLTALLRLNVSNASSAGLFVRLAAAHACGVVKSGGSELAEPPRELLRRKTRTPASGRCHHRTAPRLSLVHACIIYS